MRRRTVIGAVLFGVLATGNAVAEPVKPSTITANGYNGPIGGAASVSANLTHPQKAKPGALKIERQGSSLRYLSARKPTNRSSG